MDAPPQHEPLDAFIRVDLLLSQAGLNVPKILEQNTADGFLLLNDLGNETYLAKLNNETADHLYQDATHALIQMQLASKQAGYIAKLRRRAFATRIGFISRMVFKKTP